MRQWSVRQWQIIEGSFMELRHAEEQRQHWRALIAQEVLADPKLLSLVRLCGVREMVAFAMGAFIGDIDRFSQPKKLVKYVGLNPAFDDSGQTDWSGGVGGGHGHKDLRNLLVEGAQSILRCSNNALAKWGRKLLARKGVRNLAVCAVARKLTVAIWYVLKGKCTAVEEIQKDIKIKVSKIISQLGTKGLKELKKTRATLRQETFEAIKTARVYVLNPDTKYAPSATAITA
jgi:hypothetical protein